MIIGPSIEFLTFFFLGCASNIKKPQNSTSASYYEIEDNSFSLQAIAPAPVISEYAICKAVWFAEKKKAADVALSDPKYGGKPREPITTNSTIPEGWAVLDTTAYLSKPKLTKNPFFGVAHKASECRKMRKWYN